MVANTASAWAAQNQRYLLAALGDVRSALQRHIVAPKDTALPVTSADLELPRGQLPAIQTLCQMFGLSPFERDLLLLCAGVELDSGFAALCAEAHNDHQRPYPTFSLALATLPGAHWDAITPIGTLRRQRLIEVGPGAALTLSPLRISEQVLHLGSRRRKRQCLDPQPLGIAEQSIEIATQRMGRQLRVQAGTQPPKAGRVVGLNPKLFGQLVIHRLNDLAHLIDQPADSGWELGLLIASRQRQQTNPALFPQLLGQRGTHGAFITNHGHARMRGQHVARCIPIIRIRGGSFEVDNRAAERDQEVQPIAVDGLLFRRTAPECGPMGIPVAS
ncbi:MAG: hypothetical protein M3R61_16835 [Chloroflexota bacterium]|nr:hypothetical protein [Chloroflexota bacterium]